MSATDRLSGIRAKIERAKEHVRDLEGRLRAFLETDPYGVRSEDDSQTEKKVYKIDVRADVPADISLVAGKAVQQLRSALDYLAWQLVEAKGSSPGKWTYFPICETAAKNKTEAPRKVKGMSPAAISVIDALQPYQGGNDPLWILQELNNLDKPRMLFGPAFGHSKIIIDIDVQLALSGRVPGMELVGTGIPSVKFPILQDGTIIGRMANIGQSDDDVKFYITF